MTARLVRHGSGAFSVVRPTRGVVSIEPADDELEANAVELVLQVFGDSVVAIADVDIEEAKERHPSSWQQRPRPRLHPAPKGTAA